MKLPVRTAHIVVVIFALYGCSLTKDNFTGTIDGDPFNVIQCDAKYRSGDLSITAILDEPEKATLMIHIFIDRPGNYVCNDNNPTGNVVSYAVVKGKGRSVAVQHLTNGSSIGIVNITLLDLDNQKVSGDFEFEAVEWPGGSEIKKGKGKFENVDIKL
jgi:hypothetical protein